MTASKDFELRKVVREAGGSYHVVKNKLAAQSSSEGTKVEAALQGLKGVSSVAYTSGDPVALAKALATWVKDNAEFTFKLGIVDGKVIDGQEIQSLATLPGKEELFSKLLFLIQSPAQRLATVINATGRNLAVVVNMAAEQGKFGACPAVRQRRPKPRQPQKPGSGSRPGHRGHHRSPGSGSSRGSSRIAETTPEAPKPKQPPSPRPPPRTRPTAKAQGPGPEARHSRPDTGRVSPGGNRNKFRRSRLKGAQSGRNGNPGARRQPDGKGTAGASKSVARI